MKIIKEILIESILIDKLPINPSVLALVDHIRSGGKMPAIHVEISKNGGYKIKDGRHRVCAYKLLGIKLINARISINYLKGRILN
jgi:hypothetical protein